MIKALFNFLFSLFRKLMHSPEIDVSYLSAGIIAYLCAHSKVWSNESSFSNNISSELVNHHSF